MTEPHKVIVLGEYGVGKTSIIIRFTSGKFDPKISDLPSNFIRKTIKYTDGRSVTLDI